MDFNEFDDWTFENVDCYCRAQPGQQCYTDKGKPVEYMHAFRRRKAQSLLGLTKLPRRALPYQFRHAPLPPRPWNSSYPNPFQ